MTHPSGVRHLHPSGVFHRHPSGVFGKVNVPTGPHWNVCVRSDNYPPYEAGQTEHELFLQALEDPISSYKATSVPDGTSSRLEGLARFDTERFVTAGPRRVITGLADIAGNVGQLHTFTPSGSVDWRHWFDSPSPNEGTGFMEISNSTENGDVWCWNQTLQGSDVQNHLKKFDASGTIIQETTWTSFPLLGYINSYARSGIGITQANNMYPNRLPFNSREGVSETPIFSGGAAPDPVNATYIYDLESFDLREWVTHAYDENRVFLMLENTVTGDYELQRVDFRSSWTTWPFSASYRAIDGPVWAVTVPASRGSGTGRLKYLPDSEVIFLNSYPNVYAHSAIDGSFLWEMNGVNPDFGNQSMQVAGAGGKIWFAGRCTDLSAVTVPTGTWAGKHDHGRNDANAFVVDALTGAPVRATSYLLGTFLTEITGIVPHTLT